jgi:hypothetical protein
MSDNQNNRNPKDRQGRGFNQKPRRDVTAQLIGLISVYIILIIIGLTLLAEAAPV